MVRARTMRFTVADKEIGDNASPYLVAEIACAHQGDPKLALQMIDHAAQAGVDAVQIQVFGVGSPGLAAAIRSRDGREIDAWPQRLGGRHRASEGIGPTGMDQCVRHRQPFIRRSLRRLLR